MSDSMTMALSLNPDDEAQTAFLGVPEGTREVAMLLTRLHNPEQAQDGIRVFRYEGATYAITNIEVID